MRATTLIALLFAGCAYARVIPSWQANPPIEVTARGTDVALNIQRSEGSPITRDVQESEFQALERRVSQLKWGAEMAQ